jgi:hypothetical protein
MLVHAKKKSVWETCLCVALLRAEVKESSHRVASDQGRQCGIERRMCSSIVREGCREAEAAGRLRHAGGRGNRGLLLSLAVRCSTRSAHAACQPR